MEKIKYNGGENSDDNEFSDATDSNNYQEMSVNLHLKYFDQFQTYIEN